MITLRVDEPAAIPLSVESDPLVAMAVTEAFIGGGGANIQNNKNATPSTSQVVVTPDSGFDGMAKVTVAAIPPEYIIPTGTKNITANGNAQDVKSYEKVNVSVPNSYAAADEGKVVQSGALVSQTSQTINENGTYDTTTANEVVVDVQSGGGGATVIASGTFAGNNAYKITVPLGKKMAQTDFVFVMYLPDETEIPYVNDGNSVLITNAYVCIPKQISKIDLSTDNDNIQFKGGYVYNINNAGTITRMNKGGTVAASAEIQGTSSAWGIFGNGTNPGNTMVTMKRDSSGFAMKLNRNAWQSQFKSGFTYNWQVVYIGNDPTNDIVEIP